MDKRQKAEKILNRLETRRFADWYMRGRFDTYIAVEYPKGDERHVSRDDILDDIEKMFEINDDPELMEMMLCEQDAVILKADQPYVFKVDPTCKSCVKLEETYKNDLTSESKSV